MILPGGRALSRAAFPTTRARAARARNWGGSERRVGAGRPDPATRGARRPGRRARSRETRRPPPAGGGRAGGPRSRACRNQGPTAVAFLLWFSGGRPKGGGNPEGPAGTPGARPTGAFFAPTPAPARGAGKKPAQKSRCGALRPRAHGRGTGRDEPPQTPHPAQGQAISGELNMRASQGRAESQRGVRGGKAKAPRRGRGSG